MKQRTITGIIAALLLLFALVINIWVARCALLIILGLCMYEMLQALRAFSVPVHKMIPFVYIGLLLPLMAYFSIKGAVFLLALCVFAQFAVTLFRDPPNASSLLVNLLPLIYPGIPALFFLYVAFLPSPLVLLFVLFVSSFLSDCFALFFGMTFGKKHTHPLILHVSPNKTVEGCIGGFVGGTLFTFLLGVILQALGVQVYSLAQYAVFGLLGSLFTQLGDLSASYIKRMCALKDYGGIMPGHGGMLDRMDGVLLNAIWVCLFAALHL